MLKISQQNHEIMEALLKIHTENVNLRDAMAKQAVDYYLERRSGKSVELEAEIFAQAVTAFQPQMQKNLHLNLCTIPLFLSF